MLLSIAIIGTIALVVLLVYTSVIDIQHATKPQIKPVWYYAMLTTNATHKIPIDSTKYEAVEVAIQSDSQYTIMISPTSENITHYDTMEYKYGKKYLTPVSDGQNVLLKRYWPKELSVTGTLYCKTTSKDDVLLIWNWSSISEGQHRDLNGQIDCSKYQSYPGQRDCPSSDQPGTVNVADIKQTRGKYEIMTLGICALGEDRADAVFWADFEEEHYDTLKYPHYSMGHNTDNPNSITLPLMERNHKSYLYVTVTGKINESDDPEILVTPISFAQQREEKTWLITSCIVKIAAALYIINLFMIVFYVSRRCICIKL